MESALQHRTDAERGDHPAKRTRARARARVHEVGSGAVLGEGRERWLQDDQRPCGDGYVQASLQRADQKTPLPDTCGRLLRMAAPRQQDEAALRLRASGRVRVRFRWHMGPLEGSERRNLGDVCDPNNYAQRADRSCA